MRHEHGGTSSTASSTACARPTTPATTRCRLRADRLLLHAPQPDGLPRPSAANVSVSVRTLSPGTSCVRPQDLGVGLKRRSHDRGRTLGDSSWDLCPGGPFPAVTRPLSMTPAPTNGSGTVRTTRAPGCRAPGRRRQDAECRFTPAASPCNCHGAVPLRSCACHLSLRLYRCCPPAPLLQAELWPRCGYGIRHVRMAGAGGCRVES